MTAATFDTRAAAEALREAGFTEPQAIAAVDMVRDAMAENLATKTDFVRLEAMIGTGRWRRGSPRAARRTSSDWKP